MILELGDGREFQLPDDMQDEHARQMKTFILATEERARTAEKQTLALQEEMAAMRRAFNDAFTNARETAKVLGELKVTLEQGLARVEAAVSADRVMVPDDSGEYTRSRRA